MILHTTHLITLLWIGTYYRSKCDIFQRKADQIREKIFDRQVEKLDLKYEADTTTTDFSFTVHRSTNFVGNRLIVDISFKDSLLSSGEPYFDVVFKMFERPYAPFECRTGFFSRKSEEDVSVNIHSVILDAFRTSGLAVLRVSTRKKDSSSDISVQASFTIQRQDLADKTNCFRLGWFGFVGDVLFNNNIRKYQLKKARINQYLKIKAHISECFARKPSWSFEKVFQSPYVGNKLACINPENTKLINISDYTTQILDVNLPGPTHQDQFIIQPYTLPPGLFQLCNSVTEDSSGRRLKTCRLLYIYALEEDCTAFIDVLKIKIEPNMEVITWPIKDLTLTVTELFSIYAVFDDGFGKEPQYSSYWTCHGSKMCESLRHEPGGKTDGIKLITKGTTLVIPASTIIPNSTLTLTFSTSYRDPLNLFPVCSRTVQRIVKFVPFTFGNVQIRCLVNCRDFVNPDQHLMVGFECQDCQIANNPEIMWSLSDPSQTLSGRNTSYLTVMKMTSFKDDSLLIMISVSWGASSNMRNISLATRFYFNVNAPTTAINPLLNYFRESNVNYPKAVNNYSNLFNSFESDINRLVRSLQRLIRFPLVMTVSMLIEKSTSNQGRTFFTTKRHRSVIPPISPSSCTATCYEGYYYESQLFQSCYDCEKYVRCKDGVFEEKDCEHGSYFSSFLQGCTQYDIFFCGTKNFEPPVPKRPSPRDYVIIRTLWAPVSLCLDSFHVDEKNLSYLLVEFNSPVDNRNIDLRFVKFQILREQPLWSHEVDLMEVWKFTQESNDFIVSGNTEIMVLARAIELDDMRTRQLAAVINNTTADPELSPDRKNTSLDLNSTSSLEQTIIGPVNAIYPIFIAAGSQSGVHRVKKANADHKMSQDNSLVKVVESILESIVSDGSVQNQLTFSNINLYLSAMTHMTNISQYSVPALDSAISLIIKSQDLHSRVTWDPVTDDELISQKLIAMGAIMTYMSNLEAFDLKSNERNKKVGLLLETVYKLIEDQCLRWPMRYPNLKTFHSKNYTSIVFWLDPLTQETDMKVDMFIVVVYIRILQLRTAEAFNVPFDTFINVGLLAWAQDMFPTTKNGTKFNLPMVHINIKMKKRKSFPLQIISPNVYSIRFPYNFTSVNKSSNLKPSDMQGSKTWGDKSICYFYRIPASIEYASLLVFEPLIPISMGARIKLAGNMKEGFETIFSDELMFPMANKQNCSKVTAHPYSLFLPVLTRYKRSQLKGHVYYYLVISVLPSQPLTAPAVDLKCFRIFCAQLDKVSIITKFCRVSDCTGGIPSFVECRCDQGYTFSGNVEACTAKFIPVQDDQFEVVELTADSINLLIPSVVIGLWFLFVAFLIYARGADRQTAIMGKTIALEGVFSPGRDDLYLICVVTGFMRWCGTHGVPCITIVGSDKVSPRYRLEAQDYVFQSGTEIWLLVSVPKGMGTPRKVIISLENLRSKNSKWYLEEVYLRHIMSGKNWTFNYSTWIPNPVSCNLPFAVSDISYKPGSVKKIMGSIFLRLIRNQHPVLSTFWCIPGSVFTKVHHVLFCFFSVFLVFGICIYLHPQPTYRLKEDDADVIKFVLKLKLFEEAIICALYAMGPVFILGVLLEIAGPLDDRNVDWTPRVRGQAARNVASSHPQAQKKTITNVKQQITSVKPPPSQSTSRVRGQAARNVASSHPQAQKKTITNVKKQITSVKPPPSQSTSKQKGTKPQAPGKNKNNSAVSGTESGSSSKIYSKGSLHAGIRPKPVSSTVRPSKCSCVSWSRFIWLPSVLFEALMFTAIVVISYCLICLGVYYNISMSVELLYIFLVACILMILVLNPLLLMLVAIVNTVLFELGLPYYGVSSQASFRSRKVKEALVHMEEMLHVCPVESRTQSYGDFEEKALTKSKLRRSLMWCLMLIQRKKVMKKHRLRYSNLETIIFILLVILIINSLTGPVQNRFLQNKYLSESLHVGRTRIDKSLSVQSIWDHLFKMLDTISSWKSNSSLVSMNVLSAIKVTQVRAMAFTGDCTTELPGPLRPTCLAEVEDSEIDTNNYANSWSVRIINDKAKLGAYTYTPASKMKIIKSVEHIYPTGGYETLYSWWSKSPDVLTYLRDNNWIDSNSKGLIVSMNFINIDSGLATIIDLVYEFALVGTFMYTSDMYTFQLKLTEQEEIQLSCLLILLVAINVYFLFYEIKSCFVLGLRPYFKQFHSWFLLIERLLAFSILGVLMLLKTERENLMSLVKEAYLKEIDGTLFIDFQSLSNMTILVVTISYMLVIACVIKVMLRFRDYVMTATFVNMVPVSAKLLMLPLCTIVAFTALSLLLFQPYEKYYKDLRSTAVHMLILLLQPDTIMATVEYSQILGPLFFYLFYTIMFFIILNFYMGLLNECYSELKLQNRPLDQIESG